MPIATVVTVGFLDPSHFVNEGDGTVTVNLGLMDIVEPTEAEILVTVKITSSGAARCELQHWTTYVANLNCFSSLQWGRTL